MEEPTSPETTADAPQSEPVARTFVLADEHDGEPLLSVAFGGDPRVKVAAGEPYSTTDADVAARCAAHPLLIETTPAPTTSRKKRGGDPS